MGVELALDDFGTGHSSLGYLSRFPFDTLKIDRSFINGVTDNANGRAIVETILRLGRALNMRIVAEGVEAAPELRLLNELGCDEAQGYLVGRPLPIDRTARTAPPAVTEALRTDQQAEPDSPQMRAVQAMQRRLEDLFRDRPATPLRPTDIRKRAG